jgi:peptide chain release factor 1
MLDHEDYLKQFEEISQKLIDPKITSDVSKFKKLNQKYKELEEIVEVIKEIEKKEKSYEENQALIESEEAQDQELMEMAQEENLNLEKSLNKLNKKLELLTIPKDPMDERDVIVEIRAGAGGDEAGLFAADLFRMYTRYTERKGYRLNLINSNRNEVGGVKEIIAQIEGEGVFGELKFESGVHRVQRIPETEKSGRIHTSTATVAVLPKAEESDIEIKTEDVKVDTFRSSGPGGQSVNTTDSAIRLTHIPTGIIVSCQDEKSQHKNKAKAFSVLRSRLLQLQREEEQKKISDLRSSQIGTGDRSEKIRTYNYPQNRITDHRIKQNWHNIDTVMDGDLDEIIQALKDYELELKKKAMK